LAVRSAGLQPTTLPASARSWTVLIVAFIVVYDANALYPDTLRDLLIRIAQLRR
jgi:hypothetical protein